MTKKPPSAKAQATKAKREKMAVSGVIVETISDEVRQRLEDSFERTWGRNDAGKLTGDTGWVERSYPSTAMLEESDLLSAEEALAAEEQLLGKRGSFKLDDEVPDFLHTAVKAGPPAPILDHLGRTPKERERKIKDAIALGEAEKLPVIYAGQPPAPKRAVTIMRDHDLEYPDLYMSVYVAPDWDVRDDEARFARLFARSGCYRAATVEEADLVVFGGGSDVEPLLYGEKNNERHQTVFYNSERDAADIQIYLKARNQGTPMMGVCRGAQFLHVMNGGKLIQHLDGHYGEHKAWALRDQMLIEKVSSVHHQACVFNKDMEVLLTTSNASTVRWLNMDVKSVKPTIDVEAFYYRDSGCFGVQGHPEYSGYNKFSVWCLEQLSNLFLCSPDFVWEGKRLQMTPTARDAKEIAAQYVENAYNQSQEA